MGIVINIIRSIRAQLASPTLVTLALLWLSFLLIVGTIEQKYIGLYAAQQKYFSSFIWAQWGFALPATKSVLLVICLGILAKISYLAVWKPRKLGNTLVHLGVLVLLAGTLLSSAAKQEGYVVLEDLRQAGESSASQNPVKSYMEDYYAAEILVQEVMQDEAGNIAAIEGAAEYVFKQEQLADASLASPARLTMPELPFNLIVSESFSNVEIERVTGASEEYDPAKYTGFAKIFKLSNKEAELNAEENLSGAYFTVVDKQNGELVGNYGIFENMPITQTIDHQDRVYQVIMRPQRTALPFGLELVDFSVDYHPASNVAASYKSEVKVYDFGLSQQREVITMNKPLRYKEWTIYQSAFNQDEQGRQETSILVTVANSGRLLPYIAGLVIAFGLLVHLFVRLPGLRRVAKST